jgi:hypothetical protein
MQLQIEPDLAIPFPEDYSVFANFREKALAACSSAELLGLDLEPTEEERLTAEQAVYQLAENEEKANKALVKQSAKYTPATYKEVKSILDEYSVRVVDNALQIRLLVTNKLLIESQNEDAKIRIRALELLGKITDVGLFTEKSEVTVNHRSTEDLVNSIRSKIQRLMHPKDIEDAKIVEVNGETVDLDKELGFDTPKTDADAGE